MEAFYRHVRRETGILMVDDKPVGGRYSFDTENRSAWRGEPPAPDPPRFEPDEITEEVVHRVRERFSDHPGTVEPESLPATREDAERLWAWALEECLPHFGPYQDAMSASSASLFHSRISALLHLHRILPRRVVDDVVSSELPIASQEGFIRQVLGWREYVRHVHEATDGFRYGTGEGGGEGAREWAGSAEMRDAGARDSEAASPSFLGVSSSLPDAYWGAPSGLACLDRVVEQVWETGYGHHITRLMVLSNIAALLDVSPRELTDWFWVAYTDAYDWVVEPNVLGMGTFAVGDLMTTKPYVCGSAYISKMSDFCSGCRFDPRDDCPIGPMYWAYLERHREALADNPRLRLPLSMLRRRSERVRDDDARVFGIVAERLAAGRRVEPEHLNSDDD
jgi:deoxyribodipyrimidine photolyase-related protein